MSYVIEYARQFIRSDEGITPCWLSGDNNVTEGRGRHERRVRDWSCFLNLVGVSEEEIMAKIQPLMGGYQQHWKKNGKWIDDKGLINWAKNGIKNAASIEEILKMNPVCCGSVQCSLHVWRGYDRTVEARADVQTTAEFDAWVQQYRAFKEKAKKEKLEVYPVVDFGVEKLRHPVKVDCSDRFCFRKEGQYLANLKPCECTWEKDSGLADTFTYEEAVSLIQQRNYFVNGASMIKVPKEQPQWTVIQFVNLRGESVYVYKTTSTHMYSIKDQENAYRYSSPKSARAALNKLLKKYSGISQAKIIKL